MFNESELNELFRYSLALCHDSEDAYDLLYSNIEKVLTSDQTPPNNKQAYMKRCIRNSFYDLQRHKKIRLIKSESLENDYKELQDNLDLLEHDLINQQKVKLLLDDLKTDERELLYLWAVEEYTAQEIAEMQGGARGTWLSRIHRIKQKIREKFNHIPSKKEGDLS